MTTIYDVARQAGVSAATVSRVLNGRLDVNAEMAARVQQVAEDLGYRPNSVARSLRRRVAPVWALIISDIENPHFTSLVRGVEDVARDSDHSVVLCNSDENLEKEGQYVEVALAQRVAGVIMSPAGDGGAHVDALLSHGIPVVTIDRRLKRSPVSAVVVDNSKGAEPATGHLLEAGYRRVGCITGPMHTSTGKQRLQGYRRALAKFGLSADPSLEQVADYKEEGGYRAAIALLDSADPPDALFIANGLMTMGALRAAAEKQVRVPDQIGIVGFDDHPWLRLLRPSLSVVAQPTYDIGRAAAEMLLTGTKPKTVTLPTTLIPRESSRRP